MPQQLSATLSTPRRTGRALLIAAASALLLSSCSPNGGEEPGAQGPTAPGASPSAATSSASVTTSPGEAQDSDGSPSTSATDEGRGAAASSSLRTGEPSAASSSTPASFANDSVAKAAADFASLAPQSLFMRFDTCSPNGVPDSAACSGPDVGQVQFFSSEAKAASTTQLLTELRSSRVVEDSGDRVVGWSTLGSTAIVTVVDNKRGLVLQQMISSDKQDPRQRIYDLGLVPPQEQETTATTTAHNTES